MDAIVLDFDGVILDTETALIDAYGDVYRMQAVNGSASRISIA